MQDNNDLRTIRRRVAPVLRRYGVRRAAVFGSVARGSARKTSDVDLVVEVGSMGLFTFIGLKQDLEERLGNRVDLVTYRAIRPEMLDQILREQVMIYEKRPQDVS